ncbi:MAG TPA: hypothetical protein VMU94_11725 [Streptosporangiaceae bacterium]|nr:hypothetical protein [Streptosporangiaceae bacterium]
MRSGPPVEDGVWDVLFPTVSLWINARWSLRARQLERQLAASLRRGDVAVVMPPWAAVRSATDATDLASVRHYIALPSRRRPKVVASSHPEVLRYVSDKVLTVPPGAGPVSGLLLAGLLRLLRHRTAWDLAAAASGGGVVLIRRPG